MAPKKKPETARPALKRNTRSPYSELVVKSWGRAAERCAREGQHLALELKTPEAIKLAAAGKNLAETWHAFMASKPALKNVNAPSRSNQVGPRVSIGQLVYITKIKYREAAELGAALGYDGDKIAKGQWKVTRISGDLYVLESTIEPVIVIPSIPRLTTTNAAKAKAAQAAADAKRS